MGQGRPQLPPAVLRLQRDLRFDHWGQRPTGAGGSLIDRSFDEIPVRSAAAMQTTVEETAKHTVRLEVEVPPEEFAKDLDRTYRKVAGEIKIPGFRKGHVPKQIIDARVGRDVVFHEFVEQFLPAYYVRALRDHDLAPIADPEFDVAEHDIQADRPFKFTATVEVRPRLTLSAEEYTGIKLDAPDP